jgi:hypothetical protein
MVENQPMVFESQLGRGVVLNNYDERFEDRPTLFPTGRGIYLHVALDLLGSKYSVKDAVRAGVGESGDHAGWQCAEFVAHLFGLPAKKGWTPQNLIEHLSTGAANECK